MTEELQKQIDRLATQMLARAERVSRADDDKPNIARDSARDEKVTKILVTLVSHRFSLDDVIAFRKKDWALAALGARVHYPSEVCQGMVIERMKKMQAIDGVIQSSGRGTRAT